MIGLNGISFYVHAELTDFVVRLKWEGTVFIVRDMECILDRLQVYN